MVLQNTHRQLLLKSRFQLTITSRTMSLRVRTWFRVFLKSSRRLFVRETCCLNVYNRNYRISIIYYLNVYNINFVNGADMKSLRYWKRATRIAIKFLLGLFFDTWRYLSKDICCRISTVNIVFAIIKSHSRTCTVKPSELHLLLKLTVLEDRHSESMLASLVIISNRGHLHTTKFQPRLQRVHDPY